VLVTEVWHNCKLEVRIDGLPDGLALETSADLRAWYADLSKSKKWHTFCDVFDEKLHRSGCMTFNGRIIRVFKKEK